MKKLFLTILMLVGASFMFTSCGAPAANNAGNAGNKPANAANTATAPATDHTADEAAVKKVLTDISTSLSKNDADAMDKIYGDNYMLVNIDGSVQNKAERLASMRSGEVKYESFAYDDSNFRFNPEGTGAIAITRTTMKGTFKGKPMDGTYRGTLVFSKTKDGWKLVSAQASKIEAGAEPAKANDKKVDDKKAETAPPPAANK